MRKQLLMGLAVLFAIQATTSWAMSPGSYYGTVSASGVIDATKATVTAPRITAPPIVTPLNSFAKRLNPLDGVAVDAAVDASVSAQTLSGGTALGRPAAARGTGSQTAAGVISPAGIVRKLYVADGQPVRKGAPLVKIDDKLLRLAVDRTGAALLEAHAKVAVIDEKLDDLDDKERDLGDARDRLEIGKANLTQARNRLNRGLEALSGAQAQLDAQRRSLAKPPSIPALKAQLAAGQARLDSMREVLDGGFALLDTMSSSLASAETRLDEAEEQLAKARSRLKAAGAMAIANVHAAQARVRQSRAELSQALVRAPADGVVTDLAIAPGELAFSNQPLMVISEVRRVKLVLYLPPDEAGRVKRDRRGWITIDTFPERRFPATVDLVSDRVQFAPSNVATDRTYLSQVQAVTLTIDNRDGILKDGMPADAEIEL